MAKDRLKVKKAAHTGFCFGVRRAVNIAEDFLKKNKKAYSLGPIIHNPVVVDGLSEKGLIVISDIREAKGSNMLIRSHGISPRLKDIAKRLSIKLLDATCPFVKRSHSIVASLKRQGYKIIIIGKPDHPEIRALSEVADKDCAVVSTKNEIAKLRIENKRVAVVAQTTLPRNDFIKAAEAVLDKGPFECRIFNTICHDVVKRQAEIERFTKGLDSVVVVGGKMSANTKHLASICRAFDKKTFHIETAGQLKMNWFNSGRIVGVISGSSTPDSLVDEVVRRLKAHRNQQKNKFRRKGGN